MTSDTARRPPLYKYVGVERLMTVIDGPVRFTQPSAFNDPFELLPEIIIPHGEPERPISVSFDLSAQRRTNIEALDIPDQSSSSDPTSRDIVQQLNAAIGILSLSRVNDSLLMWSHYADQYAGAVIEFNEEHEFFAGQIDVEYRTTRPRRLLSDYLTNQPIPIAELCAKSKQWEYEDEVRVIRLLSDCKAAGADKRGFPVFTQDIPHEAIKSIILGERMPVTEQRAIYSRIKETKIALSLAAIDHAGYAFRLERIKFPVPTSQMGPIMSPRTAHIFDDKQTTQGEFARWLVEKHPLSKIVNKPV